MKISYKYEEVSLEELGRLDRYDFVLGFGMGLRMTAGQREQLQKAADKGTPVYIYAATNPEIIFVTWIVSPRLI